MYIYIYYQLFECRRKKGYKELYFTTELVYDIVLLVFFIYGKRTTPTLWSLIFLLASYKDSFVLSSHNRMPKR